MSTSTHNAGSRTHYSDNTEMQNLRSFQVTIQKLKLGLNESTWRASVLQASSIYRADHMLDGTIYVALTHDQYCEAISTYGKPLLHRSGSKKASPKKDTTMPPLEKPVKRDHDSQSQPDAASEHTDSDNGIEEIDIESHTGSDDVSVQMEDEDLGPFAALVTPEQRAARKYAKTLMKQGMRDRRWYVSWDKRTHTLIEEGPIDQLRRTLFGKKMRDSLSECPHLLREIGEYDIAAMWNAVAQLEQPEPYEILVRDIRRLTNLKKDNKTCLQAWLVKLEEIFDSLTAVEFPVTTMLRIGFTLSLLEADERYTVILKEAKTKVWSYEKILTKIGRHAVIVKDTAADATAQKPIPTHEQNAHDRSKGKGRGNGGRGGKGGSSEKPSESEQITILQEQQKKDRARLMCPNEKHEGGCRKHKHKSCAYKHSDSKESPDTTTAAKNKTPEKPQIPAPKGGGKSVSFKELGKCFAFAGTGSCPRDTTCKFSHESNMHTHAMSVHDLDRQALENIEPSSKTGDLVEISRSFTGHDGVYATVLSTSIIPYGKDGLTRVYQLDMPRALANALHSGFHHELSYGIPERFITSVESNEHEQNVQSSRGLLPTWDSASTVDMINTDEYFLPGSTRDTKIAVSFNDSTHSAVKPAKSGLVLISTLQRNRYIARRMLFHPRANRTILSIPKMRDLGFTFTLAGDHTSIQKKGVELLRVARTNKSNGTVKQVDRDSYITDFDVSPDSIFAHPDTLGNVQYDYDAHERQDGDVLLPSPESD